MFMQNFKESDQMEEQSIRHIFSEAVHQTYVSGLQACLVSRRSTAVRK